MSSRVLPVFAAAILLTIGATSASACDYEKSRSAKAATASTAKSCSAKSAKTAMAASAASKSCSAKKGVATVASTSACNVGRAASAVFATADAKSVHCAAAKSAAAHAECEKACSAAKSAAAAVAKTSGKVDAVVAGAQCKGNSAKAGEYAHSACESCSDWSVCEGELAKAGSQMQVVPLKNGVMYVFTSTDPNNAGRVQAVLSSRSNRLKAFMEAGDQTTLCGQCKAFRGAIASGNLTREVVNIEGGSLMIMTSPDRKMVDQLYSLAGLEGHALIKG